MAVTKSMNYGNSFWCAENELCHINALSLGNHVAADAYTFLYVTLTATRRGLPNAASCTSFPGSSTTRKTRGLRSDVAAPLPFAAAPIAPPPWAAPALTCPPPRGTNAAASPSSNPRTQRRDASAPAPQHSNPHPHPVPMPHGAGPRFQQPAPPRRRITPHGHRAVSNPPNPEAPGACDVGWGLDSRPCPTTEAETGVPGPTGEAGGNLGRSGQRVGKWSCRWRWPGLWPRLGLGQGSDGRRMGKGMLLS